MTPGWRCGLGPDALDPIEALKDAPEVLPPDDPGPVPSRDATNTPTDASTDASKEAAKALLDAQERLTAMFFLMMRDMMPAGGVAGLVEMVSSKDFTYGKDDELEGLARRFAQAVLGSKLAVQPKHMREFIEGFPERIRSSPHFDKVIAEMEGELEANDRTAAAIRAEVVRRQQADARKR